MLKKFNFIIKLLAWCIIFLSLLTHNIQIGIFALLVLLHEQLEDITDGINELNKK